jgi:hypothetical protein
MTWRAPPAPPRDAGEQRREQPLAQAGGQEPDRLARGGLDEGGDVQPLVAVVAGGDGTRADRGPHTAADRLQAAAVLVLGPDLDRPVGVRRPGLGDRRFEPP